MKAIVLCLAIGAAMPTAGFAREASDVYAPARELIADINRIVAPNGVQETFIAELGASRQFVYARGVDRGNPILLFVHGGPGAVEMPVSWTFQRPWEDFFTVVHYDQRGAGKSYALNDPETLVPTLSLERYRDDAIELIELLRKRYGKRKIVLMGHSWGSAIGLAVAEARPDLLSAYVGIGQIIDWRRNERMGMDWTLQQARARNDRQAVEEIEALNPYPEAGPFTIEKADSWRKWAIGYGSLAAGRPNADFYLLAPRLSPDYSPADIEAWHRGSAFTVTTLWPRLADVSFSAVARLEVPVVMLIGRNDRTTSAAAAAQWMDRLNAPSKKTVWLEHSAHLPMIEEPGKTFAALLKHVLPLALASQRGAREPDGCGFPD